MSQKYRRTTTAKQVLDGVSLEGKTALVTGGNTGIGYETARALANSGAKVILACRNMKAAQEAKEKIQTENPNAKIELLHFEASHLDSIRSIDLSPSKLIDLLILNAGVFKPTSARTKNDIDASFQINHLANFYLTHVLANRLTPNARVVVVSSMLHVKGDLSPTNCTESFLSPAEPYSPMKAYAVTKLCNILFAKELHRRTNITAVSLHPGSVRTEIGRSWWLARFFYSLPGWLSRTITAEQGAATTVYCAIADGIEGGGYYDECKAKEASLHARNEDTARALWEISEEMLKERGFKCEQIPRRE